MQTSSSSARIAIVIALIGALSVIVAAIITATSTQTVIIVEATRAALAEQVTQGASIQQSLQPPVVTPTSTPEPTNANTPTNTPYPTNTPRPQPSDTPRPSATLPPSDTPTPPPLFEDTFTGGMSKSWKVEYGSPIVVNDALTFEQKTLMSVGKKDWTNYIVTLETSHMGCQEAVYDNAVVIGVRYQDANNMIALRWSPCWGAWFKVENGKWNEVPNTRFTLPPLSAGGVRYPEVTANGNSYTISGGPSFVTDMYPSGKAAIIVDQGVVVDNFAVSALP